MAAAPIASRAAAPVPFSVTNTAATPVPKTATPNTTAATRMSGVSTNIGEASHDCRDETRDASGGLQAET